MRELGARVTIEGGQLSFALSDSWSLLPATDGAGEVNPALGRFLEHARTGVNLNVRLMRPFNVALEEGFLRYAEISWPASTPTLTTWTSGTLQGIAAVFLAAMPDTIVREWVVTDGRSLANAGTFASAEQWVTLVPDCDALVRSIRFGGVACPT